MNPPPPKPPGRGPLKPAGPRPPKPPPGGRGRRRPILARARLAHREVASLERLRVEFADDLVGGRAIGELDKGKPPRTPGLPIDRHDDMGWCRDGREVGSKIRLSCAVRQVPDEQTDCQGSLVKALILSQKVNGTRQGL